MKTTAKRTREGVSILKKSKFGAKAGVMKEEGKKNHDHKHKQILFDLAIELTTDNKYVEMIAKIVWLMKTGKKVDKALVMKPIDAGKKDGNLSTHLDVPNDFTDLGAYVEISRSGNRDPFEIRRSREKDHTGSYIYTDPVVYFTLAFAMDVNPEVLTHRMDIEWRRKGSKRLAVNELGCFSTVTPGAFYHLWNNSH